MFEWIWYDLVDPVNRPAKVPACLRIWTYIQLTVFREKNPEKSVLIRDIRGYRQREWIHASRHICISFNEELFGTPLNII